MFLSFLPRCTTGLERVFGNLRIGNWITGIFAAKDEIEFSRQLRAANKCDWVPNRWNRVGRYSHFAKLFHFRTPQIPRAPHERCVAFLCVGFLNPMMRLNMF